MLDLRKEKEKKNQTSHLPSYKLLVKILMARLGVSSTPPVLLGAKRAELPVTSQRKPRCLKNMPQINYFLTLLINLFCT